MPIPVSDLCADGWTVEGAEDQLAPEEICTAVTFQKDKLVFDATVMNLYSSDKLMKECHAVALSFGPGISAMTYYPDCKPAGARFSTKVNMEITRKKLIKELGKADSEIGDSLVWRGNNGKYIQPGHNFKAVYGDKGKELLYFSVEYLTKDFVPAE